MPPPGGAGRRVWELPERVSSHNDQRLRLGIAYHSGGAYRPPPGALGGPPGPPNPLGKVSGDPSLFRTVFRPCSVDVFGPCSVYVFRTVFCTVFRTVFRIVFRLVGTRNDGTIGRRRVTTND